MKPLKRIVNPLCHFVDGNRIEGKNPNMSGDCSGLSGNCSGLYGDCSGLSGDCTGLSGDCSGLRGNCSGLYGDLDKIPMQDRHVNWGLSNWIEEK